MERAAAIIVGTLGVLLLTFGALISVRTQHPSAERGVELVAVGELVAQERVRLGPQPATSVGAATPSRPPSAGSGSVPEMAVAGPASAAVTVPTSPPVTVSAAATGSPPARLAQLLARIEVNGIRFNYRSADLEPTAREVLDELATLLRSEPGLRLSISGHTDSDGDPAGNAALSARRARVVLDYLVARGAAPAQLGARAAGDGEPVASNDSEAGRQANRRAEVELEGLAP